MTAVAKLLPLMTDGWLCGMMRACVQQLFITHMLLQQLAFSACRQLKHSPTTATGPKASPHRVTSPNSSRLRGHRSKCVLTTVTIYGHVRVRTHAPRFFYRYNSRPLSPRRERGRATACGVSHDSHHDRFEELGGGFFALEEDDGPPPPPPPSCSLYASAILRSAWHGSSCPLCKGSPVSGDVRCRESHSSICARS